MEWTRYHDNAEISEGLYLVVNTGYFNWPITAHYDGCDFVIGHHDRNLPANLPITVTKYFKIPDW